MSDSKFLDISQYFFNNLIDENFWTVFSEQNLSTKIKPFAFELYFNPASAPEISLVDLSILVIQEKPRFWVKILKLNFEFFRESQESDLWQK